MVLKQDASNFLFQSSGSKVYGPVFLSRPSRSENNILTRREDSFFAFISSRPSKWYGWYFIFPCLVGPQFGLKSGTTDRKHYENWGTTSILIRFSAASVHWCYLWPSPIQSVLRIYDVVRVIIFIVKEKTLFLFDNTLASYNKGRTGRRWERWSDIDLENISISSKYTRASRYLTLDRIKSIAVCSLFGTFLDKMTWE